jgi:hypothetical protein
MPVGSRHRAAFKRRLNFAHRKIEERAGQRLHDIAELVGQRRIGKLWR